MEKKTKTRVANLCVDFVNHEASCAGLKLRLTFNEQKILELLIKNMNHTIHKEYLIDALYGDKLDGGALTNTLKVNICTLREKIRRATGKDFILTIPWMGYQFVRPQDWYPVYARPKRRKRCENNLSVT